MSNCSGVRWTFIFIGLVTALAVYYMYYNNEFGVERFNSVSNGAPNNSNYDKKDTKEVGVEEFTSDAGSPDPTLPTDNLGLYINVFLDPAGDTPLYLPSASKLLDALNPQKIAFTVVGNPPITLTSDSGLPIANLQLNGPPSNVLTKTSKLSAFTLMFFMKINELVKPVEVPIIQIFTESPNYLILTIQNDSTNKNYIFSAYVGTNDYTWTVPVATPAKASLYVVTYNTTTSTTNKKPTIKLYIDGTVQELVTSQDEPCVGGLSNVTPNTSLNMNLGISPIMINNTGNLDANLYAALIYNKDISTHSAFPTLTTFFNSTLNGYYNIVKKNHEIKLLNEQLLDSTNAQESKITTILADLEKCNAALSQAQETIKSNVSQTQVIDTSKWQIQTGNGNIGTANEADLDKCSPLTVKMFGASANTSGDSNVQKKLMTEYPRNNKNGPFFIPYPSNDVATSVASLSNVSKKPPASSTKKTTEPTFLDFWKDVKKMATGQHDKD